MSGRKRFHLGIQATFCGIVCASFFPQRGYEVDSDLPLPRVMMAFDQLFVLSCVRALLISAVCELAICSGDLVIRGISSLHFPVTRILPPPSASSLAVLDS